MAGETTGWHGFCMECTCVQPLSTAPTGLSIWLLRQQGEQAGESFQGCWVLADDGTAPWHCTQEFAVRPLHVFSSGVSILALAVSTRHLG
jgi:hypothetical protein